MNPPPSVEPYDAAFCLGAMLMPDGRPSPAMERRVRHGVRLLAAGRVRHLVMSGGPTTLPTPEAKAMRALALALGAPPDRVLAECAALNTIGNARLCAAIAAGRGWRRLMIVTDAFHLPRALYAFRRFGIRAAGAAVWPGRRPAPEWYAAWIREAFALPWTVIRVERLKLLERWS